MDNSSNFTVGQLGAILYEWGQSHNSNLQLGYVLPERQANLIGTLDDGRDDVNIIWIYNNNPNRQSERHIDHFEGLSRMQPSAASKADPAAQSVKELESRLSAATDQPQEHRRHHAIGSLGLSNSGLTNNTSHFVPSSGTKDGKNSINYSVERSDKAVYSTDQQPRRFDKPAAIETAKILAQNQPRCRYCFRYFMSDRARDEHEKKSHPNGQTPICNWNNSGSSCQSY